MKEGPQLLLEWVKNGRFTYNGLAYKKYVNDDSAEKLLNELMKGESITVPIAGYQDYTNNRDLDSDYHKGFTIAPKGWQMYWMMIWHPESGNVTVVNLDGTTKRYISGDSLITIYWK